MRKKLFIAVFIAVTLAIIGWQLRPNEIKVAFVSDQGINENSKKVLKLIKSEKSEIAVIQGDFDHVDNPEGWDAQMTEILGTSFPIVGTIGNHDLKLWKEYQQKIIARIKQNPKLTCTGDVGRKSVCQYKNLTLMSVAPGIIEDDYFSFLEESFSQKNDVWKFCLWHKTQRALQTGDKANETGWEIYETCRKNGAIIANGHEHSYVRTHLLDNFKTQNIVSTSSTLVISPGQTFSFIAATGGREIRPQKLNGDWFAKIYTSSQGGKPGALFCTFNADHDSKKASCYFKNIDGEIIDQFEILR